MSTEPTPWWSDETVAVVIGSNRGIGLAFVRLLAEKKLKVVLTARDSGKGQAALDGLKAAGLNSVAFHTLNTNSPESVKNFAKWLKNEYGGIDILINNAAYRTDKVSYEIAEEIVETNYRGVKRVTEALLPLMRASPAAARIVNVTSRRGLYEKLQSESLKQKFRDEENLTAEVVESLATKYLEDMKAGRAEEEGWVPFDGGKGPMYAESKMFTNAYAVALAKSLSKSQPESHQILVTSYCPGFTLAEELERRIAGGFKLPDGVKVNTPVEGADTGMWLALLPKPELVKKNGKFFGEREEFPFGWVNPPT